MNIQIKQNINENNSLLGDYVLPLFTYPFGLISILIFLILFATETYYRTRAASDHALHLLGVGSFLGLCLLLKASVEANGSVKRYLNRIGSGEKCMHVIRITEDYIERGIDGFWQQQFSWRLLEQFKETQSSFYLKLYRTQIMIKKSCLENESTINEFRMFLTDTQTKNRSEKKK